MEKEPFWQSTRARALVVTVAGEVLILFSNKLGLDVDPETLNTVALAIAGLVIGFIHSRSIRNTPT